MINIKQDKMEKIVKMKLLIYTIVIVPQSFGDLEF